MNETKLYYKFPASFVFLYLYMFTFGIYCIFNFGRFIRAQNEILHINPIISAAFLAVYCTIVFFGIFMIINANYLKKVFFKIDNSGITYDQYIPILKKYIKWDEELYYMVAKSYFDSYTVQNMLPLDGKIVNQNNIQNGYIFIKTKKALAKKIDNKGSICISPKYFGSKIHINDIIKIINDYRGYSE